MQILQWLFKVVEEKQALDPSIANEKEFAHHAREKNKEIIPCSHQKARRSSKKHEGIYLDCKDLNKHLAALFRRGNLRACLNNSLYIYSVNMKKEDIKKSGSADQSVPHHVGNKVSPTSDTLTAPSTRTKEQNEHEDHASSFDKKKGDKSRGEDNKTKAMSRMKELLRWSAAAKSHKGGKYSGRKVLHFRDKGSVKGVPGGDDHELVSESPKISFSMDTEICSAASVPPLANADRSEECHCGPKKGTWITTDDEFVVLEL